jgi:hypothetical protein
MGSPVIRKASAPTITAGAYSAGDVVGGLLTIDVSGAPEGSLITRALLVDDDNEKAEITLYLFNASPTSFADNAAFAPVVADLKTLITKITFATADYVTVNSNAYALKEDLNDLIPANTGSIYGYLVCTATPTYAAASDLWIALDLLVEPRGK